MDYGTVVVHVMQPEAREYYDLDGLFGDAEELAWGAVAIRGWPASAAEATRG
jgi:hypothetical protein